MDRQLKLHKTAREMAVLAAGVQGSQSDMIRLRRVYYRLWGKVSYRDQLSGSETESARCIVVAGRRESSV